MVTTADTVSVPEEYISNVREVNELHRSASDYEQRFHGELALYRDALEDVEAAEEKRMAFVGEAAGELRGSLLSIVGQARKLLEDSSSQLTDVQAGDVRIIHQAGYPITFFNPFS